MTFTGSLLLEHCLVRALPEGLRFTIHHLSSPPTICPAIFAAPPGKDEEETYCECQFLSVAIENNGRQVQVFAIEILIYTTEYLTTLFVSKADSTGYLYLLNSPKGTPSPLRIISTAFLKYLVDERRRPDRRLVLSLFARAQNQYLFPGSIENKYKHVLDDRGLIKWWCRVVDPILGTHQRENEAWAYKPADTIDRGIARPCQGFLRVPGCDTYGTQSFFPRDEGGRMCEEHRWTVADPLQSLGRTRSLPERCLIPRFPDDPKARFLETLDEELPDDEMDNAPSQRKEASSDRLDAGRWMSVRSLDQFWEMMSFRQECSSGRLVGFLWGVFTPSNLRNTTDEIDAIEDSREPIQLTLPTPVDSQIEKLDSPLPRSPLQSSPAHSVPSTPPPPLLQPSQDPPTPSPAKIQEVLSIETQPEETRCYYWPPSSRGEVVLRRNDYDRVGKLLMRLDYANDDIAADSTRRWINDVAERAGIKAWGRSFVGESKVASAVQKSHDSSATMLNAGLVRKKKRPIEDVGGESDSHLTNADPDLRLLSPGLVRKKPKVSSDVAASLTAVIHTT